MGAMSVWHWAIVFAPILIMSLLFIYPIARIIQRTGHSPWLALLAYLPLINIAALWVFAFIDWPHIRGEEQQS